MVLDDVFIHRCILLSITTVCSLLIDVPLSLGFVYIHRIVSVIHLGDFSTLFILMELTKLVLIVAVCFSTDICFTTLLFFVIFKLSLAIICVII